MHGRLRAKRTSKDEKRKVFYGLPAHELQRWRHEDEFGEPLRFGRPCMHGGLRAEQQDQESKEKNATKRNSGMKEKRPTKGKGTQKKKEGRRNRDDARGALQRNSTKEGTQA